MSDDFITTAQCAEHRKGQDERYIVLKTEFKFFKNTLVFIASAVGLQTLTLLVEALKGVL